MKDKVLMFSLFSILFFVCACTQEKKEEFASINDLAQNDTLKNEYAESFRIMYTQNGVQIDVIDPTTQAVIKTYDVDKEVRPSYNSFTHQLNRIVTLSTTQIGMLRKLGLETNIIGVANHKHLCHPMSKSSVMEVGEIGMTDAEAFLLAKPDVILYSGFNLNAPILNKFEQAGLKTFLMYEWKETHPLGRAEWIKVLGALFQRQKEAKAIFEQIKLEYAQTTKALTKAEKQPTVFAGTYFGDVFNVPAGNSYMAQLLKDANVNYVYKNTDGTGSLSLSLEELLTSNKDTEFWLNANAQSKEDLLNQNQKFEMLKSFKMGKLYSYAKKTNCFWENSSIEPHKVLQDLGKIFHPYLYDDLTKQYYSLITSE
ncbi:ABC transporter substrate-binding protein [Brumimicrobium salinarum]|nr:ABC transporter substrate-binding protein [Brumimicrobium salinarum]